MTFDILKTRFTVEDNIIASRFLIGKLRVIQVDKHVSGLYEDVANQLNNLSKLDDDMFTQLSEIYQRNKTEEEVM